MEVLIHHVSYSDVYFHLVERPGAKDALATPEAKSGAANALGAPDATTPGHQNVHQISNRSADSTATLQSAGTALIKAVNEDPRYGGISSGNLKGLGEAGNLNSGNALPTHVAFPESPSTGNFLPGLSDAGVALGTQGRFTPVGGNSSASSVNESGEEGRTGSRSKDTMSKTSSATGISELGSTMGGTFDNTAMNFGNNLAQAPGKLRIRAKGEHLEQLASRIVNYLDSSGKKVPKLVPVIDEDNLPEPSRSEDGTDTGVKAGYVRQREGNQREQEKAQQREQQREQERLKQMQDINPDVAAPQRYQEQNTPNFANGNPEVSVPTSQVVTRKQYVEGYGDDDLSQSWSQRNRSGSLSIETSALSPQRGGSRKNSLPRETGTATSADRSSAPTTIANSETSSTRKKSIDHLLYSETEGAPRPDRQFDGHHREEPVSPMNAADHSDSDASDSSCTKSNASSDTNPKLIEGSHSQENTAVSPMATSSSFTAGETEVESDSASKRGWAHQTMCCGFDISEMPIPNPDQFLAEAFFSGDIATARMYQLDAIVFPIFALCLDCWLGSIAERKIGCDFLKVYFLSGSHQRLLKGTETFSTESAAKCLVRFAEHQLGNRFVFNTSLGETSSPQRSLNPFRLAGDSPSPNDDLVSDVGSPKDWNASPGFVSNSVNFNTPRGGADANQVSGAESEQSRVWVRSSDGRCSKLVNKSALASLRSGIGAVANPTTRNSPMISIASTSKVAELANPTEVRSNSGLRENKTIGRLGNTPDRNVARNTSHNPERTETVESSESMATNSKRLHNLASNDVREIQRSVSNNTNHTSGTGSGQEDDGNFGGITTVVSKNSTENGNFGTIQPMNPTGDQSLIPAATNANIFVRSIHSGPGVFLYDENVAFMNDFVLPHLDRDREECVRLYTDQWAQEFGVSFILAEGAPARISAITQSLHQFRPNYVHILRPKSYRDEAFLRVDGVQFLEHSKASTAAPLPIQGVFAQTAASSPADSADGYSRSGRGGSRNGSSGRPGSAGSARGSSSGKSSKSSRSGSPSGRSKKNRRVVRYTGHPEVDRRVRLVVNEMRKHREAVESVAWPHVGERNDPLNSVRSQDNEGVGEVLRNDGFYGSYSENADKEGVHMSTRDKKFGAAGQVFSSEHPTNRNSTGSDPFGPADGNQEHEGLNIEVSMPTGSLCAERNCIGTAIASDPTIMRQHIKMIAVLSMPSLDSSGPIGNDGPLTSMSAMPTGTVKNSRALGRQGSSVSRADEDLVCPVAPKRLDVGGKDVASPRDDLQSYVGSPIIMKEAPKPRFQLEPREERLFNDPVSEADFRPKKKKQELLLRGKKYRKKANDQNPLGPCGACMEWLKKIAEREPSFRVVTFDTYDCQNIFVTRINPY